MQGYTLNRDATEENLYEDFDGSSCCEAKSPEMNEHFEEQRRF